MPRATQAALAALVVILAGCGGGGGTDGGQVDTAPVPEIPEQETVPGGTFTGGAFQPPFTLELPEGWRPIEDQPDLVQIVSGATEGRALTFSAALADTPVPQAVEQMRSAALLTTDEPSDVTVGAYSGQVFTGQVEDDTEIPGVQYFAVSAFRMRIWALDVDGRTVVVIADALETEADAFFAEVEDVLGTLSFAGA